MLEHRVTGDASRWLQIVAGIGLLWLLNGCALWHAAHFWVAGEQVELRDTDADDRPAPAEAPGLLVLAIDGIDRHLLYRMLKDGELPNLARLLGDDGSAQFAHAYFQDSLVSVLPSSTGVSWASMITGRTPADNGVTGNEYFIRETGQYAAPVPVTIHDPTPVLSIYTEEYANTLLEAPTVYQRMRRTDPGVRIWVGMHQYYTGADRLILTDRTALLEAARRLFAEQFLDPLTGAESLSLFREIDSEVVENMADLIDSEPPADVITLYLPGLDHYAHITDDEPDVSRRRYLREGLEPMMGELYETLSRAGALDDRYVVLTSDHGHTGVLHDDAHSLSTDGSGEPAQVLEAAGFTLRPYELEVDKDTFFDSVLAYQGAMAYVYVADRTTCARKVGPCDWRVPARSADIRSAAQAFWQNNRDGLLVPEMRSVLDMILVRTAPSRDARNDASKNSRKDVFEVYTGNGKSQPIEAYLAAHPHADYVDMPARLRDLTIGPYGDRAGDIILVAHNGDRSRSDERYYFAPLYHSWHGSPSHRDSDIPLIVANPSENGDAIRQRVERVLAGRHEQRLIADVLLDLRDAKAQDKASAGIGAGDDVVGNRQRRAETAGGNEG